MMVRRLVGGRRDQKRVLQLALILYCSFLAFASSFAAAVDAYFSDKSTANVYVAPVVSSISKVAILTFKAPTELIGSSVSDIFVTEMLRARRYTLVERGQIDRVLGETEFALSGLSESAAIEAGKMMGADGVILGTVDEYGTVAHRGKTYPVVGVSIRLIDCTSGRVMWSAGHARRAQSPTDTLSSHARAIVHEMMCGLVQNLKVQRQVAKKHAAAAVTRSAIKTEAPVSRSAQSVIEKTPPPDTPAGFCVSDFGLREVRLSWKKLDDRSLQYRVERTDSPDGLFTVLTTVSAMRGSYVDSGEKRAPLRDATTYYYRLVAIGRDKQESSPSAILESMTAPPPEPPAALQAQAPSARAVRLEWTPPGSEGVVRYIVERADAENRTYAKIGEVIGTSLNEGGTSASPLKDSTVYLYRLRSVNRVGSIGEPSKPVKVSTRPRPAAPQGLAAESSQVRCVPLEWQIHQEEDVTRYDIYRAEAKDEPFDRIASVNGRENTTYCDGGAEPGSLKDAQTYFYRIRAVNGVTAESADSETISAITRAAPPVVENLIAVTGLPRRIELSWSESPDKKVVGYEIDRSEAGGAFLRIARVSGRDTTNYKDAGEETTRFMRSNVIVALKDGMAYAYRIRAFNAADAKSDWIKPVAAMTKVVPVAPTGLKATRGIARTITLTWSANPEEDIAKYAVASSPSPDRNFLVAAHLPAGESTTLTQEDLGNGQTRYYHVKAIDADGLESDWSQTARGETKPIPDPPTNLEAEWTDEGALVRWVAPPQSDIVRYRVFNNRFPGRDELGESDKPEFLIPLREMKQKKVLMVVAVDEDNLESPLSEALTVAPQK